MRADVPGRLLAEPGFAGGAIFDRTEENLRSAVNFGCSEQILPEEVSPYGGADCGCMRDKSGTLKRMDDGASVDERIGEESLLSSGKANGVIKVMANLAERGQADWFGALERVGSRSVFPAVTHKTRGKQSGPAFRVSVLDVQNAKGRVGRVLRADRQEFGDLVSHRDPGGSARSGGGGGGKKSAQSSRVNDALDRSSNRTLSLKHPPGPRL